jgi:hypothetical protein
MSTWLRGPACAELLSWPAVSLHGAPLIERPRQVDFDAKDKLGKAAVFKPEYFIKNATELETIAESYVPLRAVCRAEVSNKLDVTSCSSQDPAQGPGRGPLCGHRALPRSALAALPSLHVSL